MPRSTDGPIRFRYWLVYVNNMFIKTIPADTLEDALRLAQRDYPNARVFVEPDPILSVTLEEEES